MKATLFMAVSVNGYIARKNGEEDFLPHEGWLQMLEFAKQYGNIIFGRQTYDTISLWGENYLKDLKDFPIILLSNGTNRRPSENLSYVSSVKNAIRLVNEKGFKKPFLCGGSKINTSFAKENLIDEIILNYNSKIIGEGIPLFDAQNFDLNLEIENIKNISPELFQVKYKVLG